MFGTLTTCYLFLGGAGGGALSALSVLELDRIRRLNRNSLSSREAIGGTGDFGDLLARAWPICFVALALGVLCLLADLGRPDRALNLLVSPTLSPISIGTFALVVALALSGAFAAVELFDDFVLPAPVHYVLAVAGAVAGLTIAAYTGVLLNLMASVLFWRTPLLPALFVLSSLSCGIACVLLAVAFAETSQGAVLRLDVLLRIDGVCIALEAICLAVWVAWGLLGSAAASAQALVSGELAWAFWGGVVALGMCAPVVLGRMARRSSMPLEFGASYSPPLVLGVAVLVLAGGFLLRWCVVATGSFDVTQMADTMFGMTVASLTAV